MVAIDNFTAKIHKDVYPNIDPCRTSLPVNFTVCIIGASSGIGEHIAYAYAKAGAAGICISSRRASELYRVSQAISAINDKIHVEVVACDISSAGSVEALASTIRAKFGRLDALVPNSGYAGPVTLKVTEGSPEWFQQNFDVNTLGTYHTAHYLIPLLLETEDGARLFVCVGSFAACITQGPIANTGYCLSKFAQSRLIEFLGIQFGDQGLLAVNVHPGAVLTPMAEGNTPEVFLPYLIDSVDLCGAFCVWLSGQRNYLTWLNGRFLSATWDVEELVERKEEIVEGDLLKWKVTM